MASDEHTAPRKAIVTGASRGIGAAIIARLAADGYEVAGTATTQAGADRIRASLEAAGATCSAHVFDATDRAAAEALAKATGPADILVCNAGIVRDGLTMRMKDADWDDVLAVNLSAPFTLARAYVREMARKRWGRIVMISSVVASIGGPGQANYTSAKAGLEGLTRALAKEFAPRGITVNAVAPGYILTDMTKAISESDASEGILAMIPLGRAGAPKEVAAAVGFLASDEASYITGTTLAVNGGMLMG